MYSLSEIAGILGRDRVTLLGWVKRFELPVFSKGGYPECYMSFIRSIVYLRLSQVTESQIIELWKLEFKLLRILHADSLGSATWMIDGHKQTGHEDRRLFLSRYDLGTELRSSAVQPGLDFSESESELFAGLEMGEDTLRLLDSYMKLLDPIQQRLREQAPILIAAGRWARGGGW
ncbi:hypothetical protein [Haloferula sp.]|uniref:hypothetical protein n=1 Tax=Haloferula sp. TaxID=2497595 RepID=UPI003C727638